MSPAIDSNSRDSWGRSTPLLSARFIDPFTRRMVRLSTLNPRLGEADPMPTKILAIDDSKTMRLAIKITFAAEDAEVVAVSRGSEALARAKQMPADVLLVDHALASGEPSGFDVCRSVKADPEAAHLPVVLMIPAHGGVGAADVQACGADASLRKPFETQELIDTVARVVGQAVSRSSAAGVEVARATATSAAASSPTAPVARIQPRPPSGPTAAASASGDRARPAASAAASSPAAAAAPGSAETPAARPAVTSQPSRPPIGSPPVTATPRDPAAVEAGPIPIAIPIPFAPANAPTPKMLERLRAAAPGSAAEGLDPQAVAALLRLSHEVVEQVVWEVVPDLAAEILEQRAQQELRARADAE
ncbi:MAG: response regulator [Myxococcales bacterium FL481]|nr:MAG: response regulator [Myxococcales bacterium FL481]